MQHVATDGNNITVQFTAKELMYIADVLGNTNHNIRVNLYTLGNSANFTPFNDFKQMSEMGFSVFNSLCNIIEAHA